MRFDGLAAWLRGDPAPDGDAGLRRLLDGAVPFAVPLRRRFRGVTQREGLLLSGPCGWGEFAPFAEYPPDVAARWLAAAVEAAFGTWPAPQRDFVPVNAIIPAVAPDDAAQLTRAAVRDGGCTTVKVKVAQPGESLRDDDARLAAVRDALDAALGPGLGRIRIDVNAAWDVPGAVAALGVLRRYDLEYAEQPCRTLAELAEVRRRVDVPIAADEAVRLADDPAAVRLRDAVDVAIVKVPPLGGVAAALRVAAGLGVPVVVSGALDTSVGLAAGVALAAALPDLPYACGLGTGTLFADDVVADPSLPRDGRLPVVRTAPDPAAVLRAGSRVPDERARAWRHRLAAAWRAGARERVGVLVDRSLEGWSP